MLHDSFEAYQRAAAVHEEKLHQEKLRTVSFPVVKANATRQQYYHNFENESIEENKLFQEPPASFHFPNDMSASQGQAPLSTRSLLSMNSASSFSFNNTPPVLGSGAGDNSSRSESGMSVNSSADSSVFSFQNAPLSSFASNQDNGGGNMMTYTPTSVYKVSLRLIQWC